MTGRARKQLCWHPQRYRRVEIRDPDKLRPVPDDAHRARQRPITKIEHPMALFMSERQNRGAEPIVKVRTGSRGARIYEPTRELRSPSLHQEDRDTAARQWANSPGDRETVRRALDDQESHHRQEPSTPACQQEPTTGHENLVEVGAGRRRPLKADGRTGRGQQRAEAHAHGPRNVGQRRPRPNARGHSTNVKTIRPHLRVGPTTLEPISAPLVAHIRPPGRPETA
ncbi:hypothetical protein HETIRDRAFT_451384 [Heterobasidion irregulare TC 32-1]|uniref:Uncharacterized protein n=1 Tax=Heterobasidion irregulare (strain TC 32-1) TaxID=747525 RepID=W4K764_HETIT|nr:uncharacterized protein HETIRDRAFT_451384 [Heterobasidion irregulare TC 32-1]ETW81643.1 hypothetical protein HETIRDRAFT_451384 [Heterobasidion irregulare TC 32-1]